ncbi:hypothetical protein GIB67_038294, partial [Kingdonia uniflora]
PTNLRISKKKKTKTKIQNPKNKKFANLYFVLQFPLMEVWIEVWISQEHPKIVLLKH